MGPTQYAAVGDTVKKGVSNMINRKSNKEQLAQQRQGLLDQRDYVDGQSDMMRNEYDSDMMPYTAEGTKSSAYLGNLDSDIVSNDPLKSREDYKFEMGDFTADPGYEFRKQQGTETLDQSAAGDGSLYSGGQQKALLDYGQNLASDEYQNVYDRDMGEFQDMNSQFQDARDYNTDIDVGNMNRDVANNQYLASQGFSAATKGADASKDIYQDQTQFGVNNIGALSGNTSAKTANKYGFARDQNEIAGDGFVNFMGGLGGSGFGG